MIYNGGKNAKKKSSSTSKRHFTVVMGNKEHGLYVSSTPSSAAKKAVTKLCASNKSKKVEFHIREITQGSKKKTYGPYEGYIDKLKEPIELKGRVIRYKPVAKLIGKKRKDINLSNKKGGMYKTKTGASAASSASNSDSTKKIYPRNLHEVKTREELQSLIAWVKFVETNRKIWKEYIQSSHPRPRNNNNDIHAIALNDENDKGFTYQDRENLKSGTLEDLNEIFKDVPSYPKSTYEERMELGYLLNFITHNSHDGFGPYDDEGYFKAIKKYVLEMKKNHPEWKPNVWNNNADDWNNNYNNNNNNNS